MPAVDPLPLEIVSLTLASPAAAPGGQLAESAAGNVNSDNSDFLQSPTLPYIEHDNLYKQVTALRGDHAFMTSWLKTCWAGQTIHRTTPCSTNSA